MVLLGGGGGGRREASSSSHKPSDNLLSSLKSKLVGSSNRTPASDGNGLERGHFWGGGEGEEEGHTCIVIQTTSQYHCNTDNR